MRKDDAAWTTDDEDAAQRMVIHFLVMAATIDSLNGAELPDLAQQFAKFGPGVIPAIRARCGYEQSDPRFIAFFDRHIEQYIEIGNVCGGGRYCVVGTGQTHCGQTPEVQGTLSKLFRSENSRSKAEKVCEELASEFPGVAFEVYPQVPAALPRSSRRPRRSARKSSLKKTA